MFAVSVTKPMNRYNDKGCRVTGCCAAYSKRGETDILRCCKCKMPVPAGEGDGSEWIQKVPPAVGTLVEFDGVERTYPKLGLGSLADLIGGDA